MKTAEIISGLQKKLKDSEYREIWNSNIAMCFYDEYKSYKEKHKKGQMSDKDILSISNKSADRFLDLLISK